MKNIDPKILKNLYWNEKLSLHKIAKKYNVSYSTIRGMFVKNKLSVRTKSQSLKGVKKKIITDEKIKILEEYWSKHYLPERWIRKQISLSERIYKRVKKKYCTYEQIKFLPQNLEPIIFEQIIKMCKNNIPYKEIAVKLELKHKQVRSIIVKLSKFYDVSPIPKPIIVTVEHKNKLSKSLAKYNRENPKKKENNPNWKGGISTVSDLIRSLPQYKEWRKSVYRKDKYKCVVCGNNKVIHADHIYPFVLLLIDGNIKTVNEAINYKPLWNINNGRTLCFRHHAETETFGKQRKYYENKV